MVAQKAFDFRPLAEVMISLAVFTFVVDPVIGYDRFLAWGGGNASPPLIVALVVWLAIHASIRWVLNRHKGAGTAGFPPQRS